MSNDNRSTPQPTTIAGSVSNNISGATKLRIKAPSEKVVTIKRPSSKKGKK